MPLSGSVLVTGTFQRLFRKFRALGRLGTILPKEGPPLALCYSQITSVWCGVGDYPGGLFGEP